MKRQEAKRRLRSSTDSCKPITSSGVDGKEDLTVGSLFFYSPPSLANSLSLLFFLSVFTSHTLIVLENALFGVMFSIAAHYIG